MEDGSGQRSGGMRMASRILRLRCPRCGRGRLFRSFFIRAERCENCEWRYEREEGFWVGGSEVHMLASYGISVVIFMPMVIVFGPTPTMQGIAILGHIVCSLLLFRYSRSIFIGLDYMLDPGAPETDDDDGGNEGVPVKPSPRSPSRGAPIPRRRPAHVDSGASGARAARKPPRVRD